MSEAVVHAYRAAFDARADTLPGAGLGWLSRLRHEAIEHFCELGFPGPRHEDWRMTPVKPIAERALPIAEPVRGADSLGRTLSVVPEAARLTFVDGHFVPGLSILPAERPGVHVQNLASALAERPDAVEGVLGRTAETKTDAFRALNTALFADGLLLELDEGVRLEQPLHALFVASGAESVASPRIALRLGAGSSATLVEQYAALGSGASLTNALCEIDLGPGAALDHVKLQAESERAWHIASIIARQAGRSRLRSFSIAAGGRLARTEITAALEAEGAHCDLLGLYLAHDAQLVDHHTWIDHAAPQTTSRELYKGILGDRARGVFRGRVHVRPDAQQIEAEQSHRSLMLSDDAAVYARPQLEIYADDVKCSHGNAIGQLDLDALFYLRSRGIPEALARATLTAAFAREVLEELPLETLRSDLDHALEQWLA
jgi:Fe-S cluster assembly protein SufD